MNVNTEISATPTKPPLNDFEKVQRFPDFLSSWEQEALKKIDDSAQLTPLDRQFAVLHLHSRQMEMLAQFRNMVMVDFFGEVGAAGAYKGGGPNLVEFSPDVALYPETLALNKIERINIGLTDKLYDEFDDFVVNFITEVGKKLDPPQNLAKILVQYAIECWDNQIPDINKVSPYEVSFNLACDKSNGSFSQYKLNQREADFYQLLWQLRKPTSTSADDSGSTHFDWSVRKAMQYVYEKARLIIFSDHFGIEVDASHVEQHLGSNALETSIWQMYEQSGLRDDPSRWPGRSDDEVIMNQTVSTLKSYVEGGPPALIAAYASERCAGEEYAKIFDFPGKEEFLD